MDDKKIYSDINRIINAYVMKEEDQPQSNPEVQKTAEIANREKKQAIQAEIASLKAKIKELEGQLTENHEPGEEYEYDYEGSMAKTQLCQIHQAATKMMKEIEHDQNLPEWVQSKIAVACDYMIKVASYMDATEEQDSKAENQMEKPPMPNLPKPPSPSSMMSTALGNKPMVGFSFEPKMGSRPEPSMDEY